MRYIFFFILAVLTFAGCKKDAPVVVDMKYDYFPVETGKVVVYEVDSFKYNPLFTGGIDTVRWQLREEIADAFIDNEGREAYRVIRSIRKTDADSWQPEKVFFTVRENNRVERQEDNLRFIKLVFPPKVNKTWNGTALITIDTFEFFKDWEYIYTDVDNPAEVNGLSFDSTVTVLEVDDENLLEKRYSEAIYAKGVGLIYKEQYDLRIVDSSIPSQEIPWEEKANRGYIVRMKVKSYQ